MTIGNLHMKRDIYLIADNIRSAHNVGSLLRTAEGLGINLVMLCGYTPYPSTKDDDRLPYIAKKINDRITKTALGAQETQKWKHFNSTIDAINSMKSKNIEIVGLEQTNESINLSDYEPKKSLCLIVGNEINGISKEVLDLCDYIVVIPMSGLKESFNVTSAASMALYYLKYMI